MYHKMTIAGLERELPLCPINKDLYIAGFIMFGDSEITVAAAKELLKKAPEFDVIITAESKGIPLAHELARQSGNCDYVVARKEVKLYMKDVIGTSVDSITTDHIQSLYISGSDADKLRNRRVLIADDVISTGESLRSIEKLVEAAGGNIVGKMTVLAEGDAADRDDIIFLERLPLFDGNGKIL